jgi:hypothetical protein
MGKILGEPFKKYVVDQINQRQEAHGSGTNGDVRDLDQLTYLNSKTAWVKLASGVFVTDERRKEEKLREGFDGDTLAKRNVLFGGTSDMYESEILKQRGTDADNSLNITNKKWGTYNVNAFSDPSEFGLVPMPGITSVDVKAINRGSIKKATINLKCYSPEQFKVIDLLYLRLGYTVFLEWGNSLYLDNDGKIVRQNFTLTEEETYGFFSKRWKDSSYAGFLPLIEAYRKGRMGNYDGLLAKIVNFSWAFAQDGSYDITLELISLGDVVESLKLNIIPTNKISKFIKAAYSLYSADQEDNTADDLVSSPANNAITSFLFIYKILLDKEHNPEGASGGERITNRDVSIQFEGNRLSIGGTFITPPTDGVITIEPIYTDTETFDTYAELEAYMRGVYPNHTQIGTTASLIDPSISALEDTTNAGIITFTPNDSWILRRGILGSIYATVKSVPEELNLGGTFNDKGNVFYMNYNEGEDDEDASINDAGFYMRWGHLLQYINNKIIPVIKNNNKTPILKLDFDQWSNKMYTLPYQVSLDPRVCLINPVEDINNKKFYPEITPFKNPSYNYAWTMNIFLSHNQIISSLNENTDEKGNVAIFDFINSLCIAVNKALGGINNLEPFLDEDNNTLYIVDASYQPPITQSPYILELYGYNGNQAGFVRNFNLKTEITSDFATMASIGSTAGGYVKGTENTMFSKWNKGLIDRWKEEYEPSDPDAISPPGSLPDPVISYIDEFWNKSYSAFGYTLLDVEYDISYGSTAGLNDDIIDSNIELVTEFYKYTQAKIQEEQQGKYSSPSHGFIPINLGITMDGISGIKIYNEVNVDTKFLPQNYPDNLRFIIKGVNHKLSDSDWETNLETIVIAKSTDDTNQPLSYEEAKRIIDIEIAGSSGTGTTAATGVVSSGLSAIVAAAGSAPISSDPNTEQGYPENSSTKNLVNKANGERPYLLLPNNTIQVKTWPNSTRPGSPGYSLTQRHWFVPNPNYPIVSVNIPYVRGEKLVYVHKDFADKLKIATKQIKDLGLQKYIKSVDAGQVLRNVTNGERLSHHAFGFAIDLNVGTLPGTNWGEGFNLKDKTYKSGGKWLPMTNDHYGYWRVARVFAFQGIGWYYEKDAMHLSIYEGTEWDYNEYKIPDGRGKGTNQ